MSTQEDADLQALWDLVNKAKQRENYLETNPDAWRPQDGSDLAGDDTETSPYHLSHSSWSALVVAVDHLRCLRSSLEGELSDDNLQLRIHLHSQFSLVRGVIENAARAAWVLGPQDRFTRVTRRLSLKVMEFRNSESMRKTMGTADPDALDQRMQKLRDLATSAGVPSENLKQTLSAPSYKTIVEEGAEYIPEVGGDLARVIWSSCSSLSHGEDSATALLDIEVVERDQGISLARVTGPVRFLYQTALGSSLVLERSFALYATRAAAPE